MTAGDAQAKAAILGIGLQREGAAWSTGGDDGWCAGGGGSNSGIGQAVSGGGPGGPLPATAATWHGLQAVAAGCAQV